MTTEVCLKGLILSKILRSSRSMFSPLSIYVYTFGNENSIDIVNLMRSISSKPFFGLLILLIAVEMTKFVSKSVYVGQIILLREQQ